MKVLWCIVLSVCWFESCHVFGKKILPPLKEERTGHRKKHSFSECLFGKQHKELGSSWFPDLGPPFHVMYCIKCECLKVVKEGRIFGHVNCRNIAKDCPELACEDQIQVVGRCCKVCRNDTLEVQLQDVTPASLWEEEEPSYKHYAALLTSTFYVLHKDSANGSTVNSVGQYATGRFTLHKRNLYYSFYTTIYPLPTRPKTIQFVDNWGNILEEQQVPSSSSLYQNLTGKLCGVWRRVPSEYRSLLKEEKLSVVLIWEEYDVRIRGALMRYVPLPTEMFSSLMVSSNDSLTDAAGTAIVSISTVTPAVHVMVVFTGLMTAKRRHNNQVVLKLFAEDKQTAVLEKRIPIEKPSPELNIVRYSTAITGTDLQGLAQQRFTISLSNGFGDTTIQGKVMPRVQCELHQAVLSTLHQSQANMTYKKSTKASGLAWMFIDRNSALRYYLTLDNVADVSVDLVTARHQTVVEHLSNIGLLNGTVSSVSPKYLEQLYDEELAVNVAKMNGNNPSLIRGRLVSRLVADSRDSAAPYLLKRSDTSVPADMVGLIWARIDGECNLYYDISVVGKDVDVHQFELYLEDIPFLAPGAPVTRRLLDEFSGSGVEGVSFGLSPNELARLDTSVVYLDIWDMKRGQSVLRTRWDKMSIPESCLPRNVDKSVADNNIPTNHLIEENEQPEISKCFHGSQFYDHGTQWTSTVDDCTMCNCNHGVTKCDVILCPELNCPQKFKVPGSCCPSCTNTTQPPNVTQNGCSLGGQIFAPGSAWYPYIPPNGFATCTVCHCDAATLQVKCGGVKCPVLNCDEKLAYRPEKKSCCKVCPNKTQSLMNDSMVSDQQGPVKTDRDILLAGGCKYSYGGPFENGKEWHPRIYFHGIDDCVTCRCKDGKVMCERKKCKTQSCDDRCCMKKAKCLKKN